MSVASDANSDALQPTRSMADFGDGYLLAVKAIADQLGVDKGGFAATPPPIGRARSGSSSRAMAAEQAGGEALGSERVELSNVVADGTEVRRGPSSQDYANHAARGS